MIVFWRKVGAVLYKDLVAEFRSKEQVSAMAVLALIVLVVFSFAFDLRASTIRSLAPGVLWVTISFAGMLGLGRSFAMEKDRGCLDGLLLCPVDRSAIYLGKALGNFLFLSAIEAAAVPLYVVLFDLPFPPALLLIVVLGTLGFCAVGTLFSAMTAHTRAREMMLPILMFPVLIPLLLGLVKATGGLLEGLSLAELSPWGQLVVVFDVVVVAISYVTFEFVVES